jgi:phosphocarrier protein HPr
MAPEPIWMALLRRTVQGNDPFLPAQERPLLPNSCLEQPPRLSRKVRGVFTVGNPKGLHTRPSTELVKCASGFRAQIVLRYQKTAVNAKSLLGILTLAAGKGSRITVEAEGEDAEEAIAALVSLAENRFFASF